MKVFEYLSKFNLMFSFSHFLINCLLISNKSFVEKFSRLSFPNNSEVDVSKLLGSFFNFKNNFVFENIITKETGGDNPKVRSKIKIKADTDEFSKKFYIFLLYFCHSYSLCQCFYRGILQRLQFFRCFSS